MSQLGEQAIKRIDLIGQDAGKEKQYYGNHRPHSFFLGMAVPIATQYKERIFYV